MPDYHLGSTIIQDRKPIAFYSSKLMPTQQPYSFIDKEILSIVESLLEFKYLLAGTNITAHTDHKNLLSALSQSDRVYRWKLAIQEFHPTYSYINGEFNSTGDTLSCLEQADNYNDLDIETAIEESFLFYPTVSDINFPLSFARIAEAQQEVEDLLQVFANDQHVPNMFQSITTPNLFTTSTLFITSLPQKPFLKYIYPKPYVMITSPGTMDF